MIREYSRGPWRLVVQDHPFTIRSGFDDRKRLPHVLVLVRTFADLFPPYTMYRSLGGPAVRLIADPDMVAALR